MSYLDFLAKLDKKEATKYVDPKKQKKLDLLESLKGTENRVTFCTNRMLDRGTVYYCTINSEGQAIVVSASSWWGMSFAPTSEHNGQNLGPVEVKTLPGTLTYIFQVGHLKEGNG